jgi:hypothetical protein
MTEKKKHSARHRAAQERRNGERRVSSRRADHRVGPGGHPGDRRTAERRDIAKKK